jgi:hypothetical protein
MYEFDSVSVSTYEAGSLAAKLTERSADGWEVVAIVPTGSDVTAYLKRATAKDSSGTTAESAVTAASAAGESTSSGVSEPAGWGTAPAATGASSSSWGSTASGSSPSDTGQGWGSTATTTTSGTPSQPATPSVPPGWYHDPSGRYELRYWDGTAWTEHVSRNGQQYTDPPVAS